MKKKLVLPLMVAAFIFGVSSCEKVAMDDNHGNCGFEDQNNEVAMSPEEFEAGIMDAFDQMEVLGGEQDIAFFMENEGIPTFLEMNPFDAADFSGKADGPCSLTGKNELNAKQKEALKQAWANYQRCKELHAAKQRKLYQAIRSKIEAQRTLLKRLLDANRITPQEYAKRMAALRDSFKNQMKERGAMHQKAMKECYSIYLKEVSRILTKAQYAIWIRCHKAHIPHKKPLDPKKRKEDERK